MNCFKQASYLGITATPFANIFIDPEDETDEAARDLFPKDFLTVLPTPENYIGADRIFGNGNADEWDNESDGNRNLGEFNDALIPIENEEQDSFFYFKHKKEIAYELTDIPASMKEAIRYFILSSAISDYRRDYTEHRSMLVNVSRFTLVQNQTADIIESFLNRIKLDLENYAQLPAIESMKINSISMLFDVWNKYNLDKVIDIDWEEFLQKYLYKATRRIEVRSVNQSSGASALDYHNYKDIGMRVIAVGGNSLSRGLTLEGLMVSYFYRNTMMYDTLLQMGRWFGYRPGYEDLFKVWMAEDAIDWYGYIIDAVNELKQELYKMKRQNLTPKEFGLKVRQAPGALLVTARNKMRTGTMVKRPITVSGRMLETPRLKGDKATIDNNEALCRNFIKSISASANWKYDSYTKSFIWKDIPKEAIIEIVRAFETHPWNLNFQPIALADYILDSNLDKWDVAIPNGSSDSTVGVETFDDTIHVNPEMRRMEKDLNYKNMIRINGHHVRVGTGGCSKIGLPKDTIQYIRKKNNKKCNDKTYLIKDRNPLLLLHILENSTKKDDDDMPIIMFALGLGFPDDGIERTANYVVNVRELENWVDDIALEMMTMMNLTISQLNKIWQDASTTVGGFLLADSEHPIEFHLGYDNGQRCFIVMNSGKVDDIVSSKAITAKNVITGNTKSLLFLLRYESLEDIFSNLCWDLITYTKQSDNPIKDLIDRFNNWQKLLQKLPNGLMSANAQKGLIGELLYLEYLIDQNGVKHAFESWVGPDGSDQDFLLDDSWTEVKTTTISSDSINISSLEQLDRDDFGRLVVYFMDKVDSPNKSTITLGDIFERVFAKLTDSQYIDSLICKTSKVGFDIKNVEKYKTIHFKLVGSSCYAVRDEFPRLTKKNIPNGIISAGYSISLSSINNYRIEEK